MTDLEKIKRGAVQIISEPELRAKLEKKKPLRIKLGVDPTAPDLHLGHTVVLNKLRQFQELGHTVVFIIGDYTAMVGDPSGRSETRPPLSREAVDKNTGAYMEQLGKIIPGAVEVHKNSDWLWPLFARQGPGGLMSLLAKHTVQQLTEREDFAKRLKEGSPLSLLELLYPLMQGYDSVQVKADVELGGTDQLFNLLMGRQMQKDAGQEAQVILTLPLLEGTDGVRKMSKSYGNHIALSDRPADMFGKVMSVSDEMMWKYYELLTEENLTETKTLHPMAAKKRLAKLIAERYHGAAAAEQSQADFEKVFSRRAAPEDMPVHRASRSPIPAAELIMEAGLAPSKNEARRLLKQGAVEWRGTPLAEDAPLVIEEEGILKVGKRQFRKVLPGA
ncbi:MAG: tyrosine--tRNA ligase [Elusimicrobiota bacterium]